MPKPPLDPDVADEAPLADELTPYDRARLVTYLRLLDADAEKADWTDIASAVLHIDATQEPQRSAGMGKPLGASTMDDGARLSTPAPQIGLKDRPLHNTLRGPGHQAGLTRYFSEAKRGASTPGE